MAIDSAEKRGGPSLIDGIKRPSIPTTITAALLLSLSQLGIGVNNAQADACMNIPNRALFVGCEGLSNGLMAAAAVAATVTGEKALNASAPLTSDVPPLPSTNRALEEANAFAQYEDNNLVKIMSNQPQCDDKDQDCIDRKKIFCNTIDHIKKTIAMHLGTIAKGIPPDELQNFGRYIRDHGRNHAGDPTAGVYIADDFYRRYCQ